MIRNEQERRNAEEQREYLRSNLEEVSLGEQTEVSEGVASALAMQIHDIERELAEYEDLKKSFRSAFEAGNLDEFGKVVTEARIARGWSQADLARVLGIKPQQVQRYESDDWQKISFWRLQEVVEALGLDVVIRARLHDHEGQDVEFLQSTPSYSGLHQVLGSVIATTTYNVPQMILEGDLSVGEGISAGHFVSLRARAGAPAMPGVRIWRGVENEAWLKETHA